MKNKKTINRVLKLIRPYTYLVVSILVLAAVTVAATLYSPILIGKGVDCMRGSHLPQPMQAEAFTFKVLYRSLAHCSRS